MGAWYIREETCLLSRWSCSAHCEGCCAESLSKLAAAVALSCSLSSLKGPRGGGAFACPRSCRWQRSLYEWAGMVPGRRWRSYSLSGTELECPVLFTSSVYSHRATMASTRSGQKEEHFLVAKSSANHREASPRPTFTRVACASDARWKILVRSLGRTLCCDAFNWTP